VEVSILVQGRPYAYSKQSGLPGHQNTFIFRSLYKKNELGRWKDAQGERMTPFSILSARLQSETPVSGVAIEPYVLVRRADGTTVTAGMYFSRAWLYDCWRAESIEEM